MKKNVSVAIVGVVVAVAAFYAHIHNTLTRPGHVSFTIFAEPTMTNIEVDGRPAHRKRHFGKEYYTSSGGPVYGAFHARPGTVTVRWEDQGERFEAEVWFGPQTPYSFGSGLFLVRKSRRDSQERTGIGRYISAITGPEELEILSVKKDGVEVANVDPAEEPSSAEQSQPSE